jgi:hypothetical protein
MVRQLALVAAGEGDVSVFIVSPEYALRSVCIWIC